MRVKVIFGAPLELFDILAEYGCKRSDIICGERIYDIPESVYLEIIKNPVARRNWEDSIKVEFEGYNRLTRVLSIVPI